MRILIISNSEWDDNNCFGNTFSNLFSGMDDIEFANIYCREGSPNTATCDRFLCVSDKRLLKHMFRKRVSPVVERTDAGSAAEPTAAVGGKMRIVNKFVRDKRWSLFFIAREILWSLSDYKTDTFISFIEKFDPDILFLPTYSYAYINKMALWISKKYHLPLVSYMSDDLYSLRRIAFSPFYWLCRIYQRRWVIKSLRKSDIVYVISDVQKNDCLKDIGVEAKVLTKFYDFDSEPNFEDNVGDDGTVKLVYAGNLSVGRAESLSYIAESLEKLNAEGIKATLDIYTPTELKEKMQNRLTGKFCRLNKPVPYAELQKIQAEANVMIHVEGLRFAKSLTVRQSFSTKLVDLFHQGCCIFAVGRNDVASIYHLIKNDAAVVALSRDEVYQKLKALTADAAMRKKYREAAYDCGKKFHSRAVLQKMLSDDLKSLVKEKDNK